MYKLFLSLVIFFGFCVNTMAAEMSPDLHKRIYDILKSRSYYGFEMEYDPNIPIADFLKSIEKDKHTYYEEPKDNALDSRLNLDANYKGFGIGFQQKKGEAPTVGRLFDGPAKRAGITKGSTITCIDDVDTSNMQLEEFIKLVRSKKSAKFCVTQNNKTVIKHVEAGYVKRYTVYGNRINEILYINITAFRHGTSSEFLNVLRLLQKNYPAYKGLIVDVRFNPGGILDESVKIIDMMYSGYEDTIVETKNSNGDIIEFNNSSILSFVPNSKKIIILANEYSASASEVVSSAMRDLRGTIIIGKKTFGKGSVQSQYTLAGHIFKFTSAKYFTKSGYLIDGNGIKPDIEIENGDEYRYDPSDIKIEGDNQLKKALEILSK